MKALPNPPVGVRMVMEVICIMLKEKPDWDSAKKVLGNVNFLKQLQEYDKEAVFGLLKKLQPYLSNDLFTEESMLKISQAAAALCKWVHAMVIYSRVSREVEPKQRKLEEMTRTLLDKENLLKEKQASLRAVLDKVAELKKKLDETLADKAYWQQQMQTCQVQLVRASKLTTGLSDEEIRWKSDAEKLKKQVCSLSFSIHLEDCCAFKSILCVLFVQIENLVGDAFLSAACISYFGPFTGAYRQELTSQWVEGCRARGIPVTDNFSLVGTLGDPVQIRDWNLAGLPTDDVSIDSALLREFGQRWPLFIDPQGQVCLPIRFSDISLR